MAPAAPAAPPLPPAPAGLLDPAGAPLLGAFAGAHLAAGLSPLARPGRLGALRHLARAKRWIWAMAASRDALAAVAVVEAGWFAGGFAWALDLGRGAVLFEDTAAGLPGRTARVAETAGAGARATLSARRFSAEVTRDGAAWRLAVEGRGGFRMEAVLDAAAAPAPFTLVAPVPGGALRVTTKAAGLPARGALRAAGRTFSLDGGAGGVDFTAGVLARETSWRWAFATGRAAGAPFGLNLCAGFGVPPGAPGENAAFLGSPYRLPPVSFDPGGAAAPWRIAGGELALVFTPRGAHAEARHLGLLSTDFVQVGGTFDGLVPGPDGAPVEVAGVPGVVEDHRARW